MPTPTLQIGDTIYSASSKVIFSPSPVPDTVAVPTHVDKSSEASSSTPVSCPQQTDSAGGGVLGLAEGDSLRDSLGLSDGDSDSLGDRDGLSDGLSLGETDGDTLGDADGDLDGEALGDADGLILGEALGLTEALGDRDGLSDGETLGDADGEALSDADGETLGLSEALGLESSNGIPPDIAAPLIDTSDIAP